MLAGNVDGVAQRFMRADGLLDWWKQQLENRRRETTQ